jgi:hypothetical protein
MEEFARSVRVVLTHLWKMEEEKEGTESALPHLKHTFRSLENAFLDINYCSLCSFYPMFTKPKSTGNRAYVLISVFGFEKSASAIMVKKGNISKKGCNLRHFTIF